MSKQKSEKTEGAVKNGQSIDMGNIWHIGQLNSVENITLE